MKKIDLSDWDRTVYFKMYQKSECPYVNAAADVDVTDIYRFARKRNLSFTYCMIYAALETANSIPNFQYRIIDGEPHRAERSIAYNTHLPCGRENFISVRCDDYDTMEEFAKRNREKADRLPPDWDPEADRMEPEAINFSSIPWIHFTQFTRPITKLGDEAIPRITFGKYEWRDGRLMMPVSTQTHHGLIDGIHIGRFFEGLAKYGNTF